MTQKYYIRLDESLASKLKEMERGEIIDALETLAEESDEGESVDELSKYERTKDIREDESISPEERKRRLIRARRRGIPR